MSLQQTLKSTRGFTLIELMVVIVIIGILATSAMSVFQGAQAKARDATRTADLEALKTALEQYYSQNDEYPKGVTAALFKTFLSQYTSKWPKDPKNTGGYQYVYCFGDKNGIAAQEYALAVRFEASDGVKAGAGQMGTTGEQKNTYVTGSNTGLVTGAASTTAAATCDSSNGGVIANS